MRQNRWNDKEAQARVDAAGADPADRTLALRVYSSRIIGADPDLVMHGGGNTSVKTERKDLFGAMQKVLHVKGSGWDLDTLEAPGLPGVRLEPLLEMRKLDALSDEDMVNMQRSNLLDSAAPTRRSKPCCMPSCRTPLSTTPTPRPFWRWQTCPMPKRRSARSSATGWPWCPTSCPASPSPRRLPKSSTPIPTAKG
jgi:hypothetical protein